MIELVWLTLLLGGALVVAWMVAQPGGGVRGRGSRRIEATARKGKVTEAFLAAVADVAPSSA